MSLPLPGDEPLPAQHDSAPGEEIFNPQDAFESTKSGLPEHPAGLPAVAASRAAAVRPPGPGILEALLWTFGLIAVHLFGGIIAASIFVLRNIGPAPPNDPEWMEQRIRSLLNEFMAMPGLEAIAVELVVFILAVIPAVWLRLRPFAGRRLNLSLLHPSHLLLIVAAVIPLAALSSGLHQSAAVVWDQITESLGADPFAGLDINQSLPEMAQDVPLWQLLLFIAVIPAVGEELVFRGVIARGLLARYGVLVSVGLTSLLFAVVHMHPAHVVSIIPLSVFLHLAYLTTRSFLAPVLLHFLNNAFAAVIVKAGVMADDSILGEATPAPVWFTVFCAAVVALIAITLWRTRVVERLPDGENWSPGYRTIEAASPDCSAVRIRSTEQPGLILASLAGCLLCLVLAMVL